LNLVLDPLLIHTFGLEVRGAAFATLLSQGIAFVYGVRYVLRKKLAPFSVPTLPRWAETRMILNLGIPSGLQMAVIAGGSAAIMSVVTSFGSDVVGGFGAAQRLDSLIMLPAMALGVAVSSMAGQNIGRRNWDRVGEITRRAVVYNVVVMIVIALIVIALADVAIGLFIQDEEAATFGANYVRIIALCYPFLGINFVLNGVVRAAGAMYQVLVLNIISFWVLRYPLTFLFSQWIGETGIAVGIGASFIVSSAAAWGYYRFGKWRDKRLFDDPVAT
jgi:putative MATE family efflux protein